MPVRAVDDKSSDTLVVVPGEGSWTGSSTLPHLHQLTFGRRRTSSPWRSRSEPVTYEPTPSLDPGPDEEMWRAILLGTDPRYARTRAWLKHVPSEPRCKMCAAPFGGVGRPLMHLLHRDRWSKNPRYCGSCFEVLQAHHGGAEIEASFLFADVRGSTSLAERVTPTEFRRLLDRFYDTASRVLVDHDAIVDKFVGDEVIGLFIPALTHEAHAARAVEASKALLRPRPWRPRRALDPDRDRRPHGQRLHRIRRGTTGHGPHRAWRCRQHDRPAGVGCGGRRGPDHGGGRERQPIRRDDPRTARARAQGQARPDARVRRHGRRTSPGASVDRVR